MNKLFELNDYAVSAKSPLRYPGGKTRAIKILKEYMPSTATNILSPFFGGGSFELYLSSLSSVNNVFGADNFKQLAVFWNQLLDNSSSLSDRIQELKDSAFDKNRFLEFQKSLRNFEINDNTKYNISDLEIASMFYAVNRSSFSGSTLSGGYSKSAAEKRFNQSSINRVKEFKNHKLKIKCDEYSKVLTNENIDSNEIDFIFLDPPYMLGKSKDKLYGNNGSNHQYFDHYRLKEIVDSISNTTFTMTYNDNDEIRSLYSTYNIFETHWSYGMNSSKESSEIIITNHDFNP